MVDADGVDEGIAVLAILPLDEGVIDPRVGRSENRLGSSDIGSPVAFVEASATTWASLGRIGCIEDASPVIEALLGRAALSGIMPAGISGYSVRMYAA